MVQQLRTRLDFETRSLADLLKVGEHTYAQHYSTQPTMLQIQAPGSDDVEVIDFLTEGDAPKFTPTAYAKSIYPAAKPGSMVYRFIKPPCPWQITRGIAEGHVFVAHNARFEQAIYYWICHKLWGWPMITKWSCTAARSRYWGLRASLAGSGSDLEIAIQKDGNGKEFINDFCKPRKYVGAKKNGIIKELWYEPHENPEGWAKGLHYGRDDVHAEAGIDVILPDLPPFEQALWELDFKMNTRGMPIDMPSVHRAIEFSAYFTDKAVARFNEITGVNPTQRQKVLDYLDQREEIDNLGDLKSKTLRRIVLSDLPLDLQDVVTIRMEVTRASVKKLDKMILVTDDDGMARGTFLYGGAHTLRWSAKRLQTHNFIRGNSTSAETMFNFLEADFWNAPRVGHNGGPPMDEMPSQPAWVHEAGLRFLRPLSTLSQSMRGFIAAPKGKKIVSGDYAQIEARVLAWLARCLWLMQAFRDKADPYVTFAAKYMYRREYESYFYVDEKGQRKVVKALGRERQVAKSAVLGCGFGLGWRQFVVYCDNQDLTITEPESKDTIKAYRGAHPEIADYDSGLWARVESAALQACSYEGYEVRLDGTGVKFHIHRLDAERYWLLCTLPSGRHIAYYRPKVRLGEKWGRPCEILSYRKEWNGMSYREDTYGGKLVENIVQGTARDVMGCGALNVEAAGFPVIGMVHDEIITLPDADFGGAQAHIQVCQEMCRLPAWITDLPVEAEGGTMLRYGK